MQFKKVDVLISENLTREQLKTKVLTELNKISKATNPRISYIANIHDIFNGKYWICMDSETKEAMGAADELIDLQPNLINAHTAAFNNPHRTTVSNLTDTTISTPKANQALVYDGTKWVNKSVSLDGSNYAKKNEANTFTKKQSGIDGTEDANFVTLRQLKTKVGLTGNETIGGVKTFSSSIVIPNATANNHSLPLGQADSRYARLLTQSLEWTVGTGGKFLDLNSAIIEANKYYSSDLTKIITLKIISNITINNRVAIFRGGCRVIVACENSNVVITVNKNNTNAYNYTFAGFGFEFRGVNINIVGDSTDNHNGTLFSFGDFKIYNLKVTGSPCMIIHNNGSATDNEYFRTNATISNLVVEYNSKMTQALVYLGNNGSLYIGGTKESNIISNAEIGFVSRSGSNITLSSGITCNNIGTLFKVEWGGIISINASSSNIILNGAIKTSQPSLTPTKAGLIFDGQN